MNEIFINPLCWLMLLIASTSYYFSFATVFAIQKRSINVILGREIAHVLTAALPLLGLLGTISGLLQSFNSLSMGLQADKQLLTLGIEKALFTTELGLLLAIPGWLIAHLGNSTFGVRN
ncbi:hypothetical protein PALB_24880 [Pseudoalteromonas luteoviolacea B = ATCC 29581]|nr:hypothetical protein PALB_24880 [Pseudoalteromonas luteoviolacea B = ATCC 29581]